MAEFGVISIDEPMDYEVVELGMGRLTCADVAAVAYQRATTVLAPMAVERAAESYHASRQIAQRRAIYGLSTGVGANKDYPVDPEEAGAHGLQLLRSHAAGAGPAVDHTIARAMLAIRVNQLGAGGSGVNPAVLDNIVRAINRGLTPPIRRYGGIGTGDLPALATTALCLMGEKPWLGGSMPACEFDTQDSLAFMSSNAATLAESALASHELRQRLDAGLKIAALSFVALGGSVESYAAEVQAARPHSGQIATAADLRRLLGSQNRQRHVQDIYGLRALPQVHGLARETLDRLDGVLDIEINAPSENPLVSASAKDVFHNGNFYSGHVASALDSLRPALFNAAALAASRLSALMEPSPTGQRPFMAEGPEASSGALILEYIGQSALAELRHLAMPDSLGTAVLSRGVEDHASFATQAAWHTTSSVAPYETVLACELVAAVRSLRQQNLQPISGPLANIFDTAAAQLDPDMADRDLGSDIDSATIAIHML